MTRLFAELAFVFSALFGSPASADVVSALYQGMQRTEVTPTTGQTVQMPGNGGNQLFVVMPGAGLAGLTVELPAEAVSTPAQLSVLVFQQAVTSLSLTQAGGGGVFLNAPTTAAAGQQFLLWKVDANTWACSAVNPNTTSQAQATRSLNSAFQVSATRGAWVSYSVQLTVTASIAGGQNGDAILEIASNAGFTNNVQTLAIAGLGQVYTLAITLQGVQPQTGVLAGYVPPGYYARLRTVNNTGTPAFSYRVGQETLL